MAIFIFLLTIIMNKIKSDCSSYSNCNSCNFNLDCEFNNNICQAINKETIIKNYLNKLRSCDSEINNPNSISKYCGETTYIFEKKKINIKLPKINGKYGKDYLFCSYTVINLNTNSKSFYLEIEKRNNIDSIILETMQENIEIESKYIYVEDGNSLYEVKKINGIIINYLSEKSFEKEPFEISIKLTKFDIETKAIIIICIVIIIIIIILLVVLIILYKKKDNERINMIINNNREREEEDNLKEKNKELCKEFVNNMTSNLFKDIKNQAINTSCNFCLNEFNLDDEVYISTCNHVFHFDEIKQWVYSKNAFHNTCPECRKEFIKLLQKGDNINNSRLISIYTSQFNNINNNNNNNENNNENNNNNINNNNNFVTPYIANSNVYSDNNNNNYNQNEGTRNNRYALGNNSITINSINQNDNHENNNRNDENNQLNLRQNN